VDHLSLYAHSFAVNDSYAAKTCPMRLMQVLLNNPLYVTRWDRMKIEDVGNRDLNSDGEGIKWINIRVIHVFSTQLGGSGC